MLSDKEIEVIREALTLFKNRIEKNAYTKTEFDIEGNDTNILLVRSARTELYIDFVEYMRKNHPDTNLYVLGEMDDKICNYNKNSNINIMPLATKGRFDIGNIEEYKQLLGDVKLQKVVFLNQSIHSRTMFNVYNVVSELCMSNSDVMKYMGNGKWMGYQSFRSYVKDLRVYTSIFESYEYMVGEEC